ncbi:HvfA family oxazolone/thioamide-modified RiPP metallophore [Sulfurimonas sp.]
MLKRVLFIVSITLSLLTISATASEMKCGAGKCGKSMKCGASMSKKMKSNGCKCIDCDNKNCAAKKDPKAKCDCKHKATMKCGAGKCGKAKKSSTSKCGTIKIDTH